MVYRCQWFQICTYNFDFKHFDHLQMVRDEVTKFPQKDRDKCAKSFCDKSCNKKEAFPPKKGTRPLCPLFSSCLEPGAIPAFILSANWVSCWFCEDFVCRQPEKWPNGTIVSREMGLWFFVFCYRKIYFYPEPSTRFLRLQ